MMKEIKIEHLAYSLKQAKDKKQPQPIFFLGAGASKTGGIPLAGEIINQILVDYSDSPFIKDLPPKERTYAKLMDCLLPEQRDELLKKYIDEAKINVTHIYLAQLIRDGFADYVLTVNFDNLMLRALALYNIFPSTYDMAILKEFTTSTFKEKSVVYLHGQNHGLWLLNTPEEMGKVKNTVPRIFDTIKNKRPWVFIGYSGEDPIFEHVKKLGRFNNGLYWVTYNDNNPNENVQEFISEPNTNAFLIKGYDSDSFMLKLNSELGLSQPSIIDKPFSALKDMLSEIVDIDEQEHFKGVKERMEIAKQQVTEAILQFELGKVEPSKDIDKNKIDVLKKEIINLIVSEKYDEKAITEIEKRAQGIVDVNLKSLLSGLYNNWGTYLCHLAKIKEGKEAEDLYQEAFIKFQKAIDLKPNQHLAFYNWGTYLCHLAKIKEGKEAEDLYQEAFIKFQKAIDLKPDYNQALYNWGAYLGHLAKTKEGKEVEDLYLQAFEKFQKAIDLKPDFHQAFYNWGNYLVDLAKTKEGKEAEGLYQEAFIKFQKAIDLKPDYHQAFNNWGNSLGDFAKSKKGKEAEDLYHQAFEKFKHAIYLKPEDHLVFYNWGASLSDLAESKEGKEAEDFYLQAIEKFQKAIDLKPDDHKFFSNWGATLADLAKLKEGKEAEDLYQQAIEKFQKAIEYGASSYNLSCLYAIKGDKENALKYLTTSLSKNKITIDFIEKDNDWKSLKNDPDFMNVLNKYR